MKMTKKTIVRLLLAAVFAAGLAGCGIGNEDGLAGSATPSQPTTVSLAKGFLATDSWGYTGSSAVELTAPAHTGVVVKERTLLKDSSNAVVSDNSPTKISYSSDATTLPAAAQASAPGTLVSYLDIVIGSARSSLPALSATVEVGAIPPLQSQTVYRFDPATGRWTSPQTAVVTDTGKITFEAGEFALYGIFR